MIPRETVNEKLIFNIKPSKDYKSYPFCTWEELINTEGLLPTDIIHNFHWDETLQETPGFGSMEPDDDYPKTYYAPSVTIVRPRPETDTEYEKRMKHQEQIKKETEEKERLEYLRLKAKFEKE